MGKFCQIIKELSAGDAIMAGYYSYVVMVLFIIICAK